MANIGTLSRLGTLLRSLLAGGAATLADVGVLALLVAVFHVPARAASVPALVTGAAVQFLGNRHFAFRAAGGGLRRQLALFLGVEAVALALNAILYDVCARRIELGAGGAVVCRTMTTFLVFLLWSYPVWHRVFRPHAPAHS